MHRRIPRGLWLAGLVVVLAGEATAIPRYAARYRQNCNLCHHNPTGGGMRSLYASQYLLPAEMVLLDPEPEALEAIQPQLSETVTLGADLRTVHHASDADRPAPEKNFFQMQGDLYVRFQADARFSAYLDRGASSTLEFFGLAYVLPYNGYVKFGRFTPAFGWKLADHRQFVRQKLFFEPPAQTDVGIEVGLYPGNLAVIASARNGARGLPFDDDTILAWAARASYRFAAGPVGFALGGSWWRNSEPGGLRLAGGPFWYVNVGPVTWLGEIDGSRLDPRAGPATDALVQSHELSWQLRPGFDLRAVFNHFDPDIDRKTGQQIKLGGGVDALITPFFGVKAMLQHYRNDRGLDIRETDYTQSEITLHVLY